MAKFYLIFVRTGHAKTVLFIRAASRHGLKISVRADLETMKPSSVRYGKNNLGPARPNPSEKRNRYEHSPVKIITRPGQSVVNENEPGTCRLKLNHDSVSQKYNDLVGSDIHNNITSCWHINIAKKRRKSKLKE